MPLAALNNSLLLYGTGLAGTCECCAVCPPNPCVSDGDCTGSSVDCVCEENACIPACVEGSCPVGFICENGHCVPDSCNSQPCISTGDCDESCVCSQGMCLNEDEQYYCCEDANGDTNCQKGPCALTDTTLGGPFNDMGLCCASGCDCLYDCNPVSNTCVPNPSGQYPDQQTCLANCADPGELGICCETMAPESNSNPSLCILRQPAGVGNSCVTTRAGCQDDRPNGITRFWQRGFDNCDLCPTSPTGACCKPDGCCEVLCEGECEDIGGTYMGNSWKDCDTMRNPPTVGTACDTYEGCRGCHWSPPLRSGGDFDNGVFATEYHTEYVSYNISSINAHLNLKDTFINDQCWEGRKIIYFAVYKFTAWALRNGPFFPTHTRRVQKRAYILGCHDGDIVDLTADALLITEERLVHSWGGTTVNVVVGDSRYHQYTHSFSNGEHTEDGISGHNVVDPNGGDTIFSNNNTTAPAAHSAIPNIEDQDYWNCP